MLLAQLLKAKDPLFDLAIKQLEDLTGKEGLDTALIGEIYAKAYDRSAKLKLDPDFNGKELYYSLLQRVKNDDIRMANNLGGKNPSSVSEMIPLIINKVRALKIPKDGWFLKESVAKRMLKDMPPPNIMRQLGYTKAAEMLKKEDIFEIYGALRFAEKSEWLNEFIKKYKDLTFANFEHRSIRIIEYDSARWGDIAKPFIKKKLHNITHLKELGVIFAMPTGHLKSMPGVTLKVLPLLIHYIFEVRLYSAFFKLISVKKNFGELLVDTLIADTPKVSLTVKRQVHWRVIQRYFGKLKDEKHPEIFEPHVQPEDLHWRKTEEVLYDIDPGLEFWQDMDYVSLIVDGDIVTFNLMDVALSYSNNLPYENRYLYHFREALWNEIFMRYLGKAKLEQQILARLDNELINPAKLVTSNKK